MADEKGRPQRVADLSQAAAPEPPDEMITFPDGLTVACAALRYAWTLEDEGITMRVVGDDLVLSPASLVRGRPDLDVLRRHKSDLKKIAEYVQRREAAAR